MAQPHHLSYRPDIDGLRAAAVLSVLFYHANLGIAPGGYVGVDVFFVISGYLITGIVARELREGRFTFAGFYARRVKRIFPALFAVLLACSLAAVIILIPSELTEFGRSLNATVLFWSNFHFIKLAGYFDPPAIDKPLLHTWSLAVEEQFYAVWPLVFVAMAKVLSGRRLLYAILALAAISFAWSEIRIEAEHPKDAFYLAYCRGWELLIGAGLAVAPLRLVSDRLREAVAGLGLAGILLPVVAYDGETFFPGLRAILPCLGAALVIAAGASGPSQVSRLLSLPPLRFVGLISYSLYLVHWPLFSFAHLYLNAALPVSDRIAIVAASFILAALSWRCIETPLRRVRLPDQAVLLRAVPVAAAIYGLGVLFWYGEGLPFRVDEAVLKAEATGVEYAKYCRPFSPASFRYLDGGLACEMGEQKPGAYDFVLWGDSHALHFMPAIAQLAASAASKGVLFSWPSCPPFLGDSKRRCAAFNEDVAGWLKDRNALRFVLLAGRWEPHKKEFRRALQRAAYGDEAGALSKTMALLNGLEIPVYILDEVPEFAQDVPHCIARALRYGRTIDSCTLQDEAQVTASQLPIERYFEALGAAYRFMLLRPKTSLCDGRTCYAVRDGRILYRDANHLTEAGAFQAIRSFELPGLGRSTVAQNAP